MDIIKYRENKRKKILLIENDQVLIKVYAEIFAREGYTVFTAKAGDAAVNVLTWNTITLVILDLMLPDMNGLEVLRFIREGSHTAKVIVLTNNYDHTVKAACLSLGISFYLYKSELTPFQLIAFIEKATKLNAVLAVF